jgi:hypothetical protein
MKVGIMGYGKWYQYLKPKWLNKVTYKEAGYKQYRWLDFYFTTAVRRSK